MERTKHKQCKRCHAAAGERWRVKNFATVRLKSNQNQRRQIARLADCYLRSKLKAKGEPINEEAIERLRTAILIQRARHAAKNILAAGIIV